MRVIITSPQETTTFEAVLSVGILTQQGRAVIRPGHAEYIVNLAPGDLQYTTRDGQLNSRPLPGGLCHVLQDTILIVL